MNCLDPLDLTEVIFRHGDVFRECARILFWKAKGNPQLGLGYGTLASLSVEQYLKCLLQIEHGQYPQSHDLQLLFNQLKTHTREPLRKIHDKRLAEEFGGFPVFEEITVGEKANLDTLLEYGKNTFDTFRYSYDHPDEAVNVVFALNLFGQIVRDRIVSLYPDWAEDLSTSQAQ